MSARAYVGLFGLLVAGALAFLGYLAWVQNAARTVNLSLELPFALAKWQLSHPVPALGLLLGGFGFGFVVAAALFGVRMLRMSSENARLRREAALSGARPTSSGGDGWK